MRIAYGVHGYGRGHATRALAVLPELRRRHALLILAGGDAYEALRNDYPVLQLPTLGYYYRRSGTRSNYLTAKHNLPGVLDLMLRGPTLQMVEAALRRFRADAAICDAEPWTHRAARRLGVPRIGFDHFGVMAYCRPEMRWVDRLIGLRDVWVYRWLMQRPERVLVSSFFDAPPRRRGVRRIRTLLRPEVYQVRAGHGDHLLVYFNKGQYLFSDRVRRALHEAGLPARVYGVGRVGSSGNLVFRMPGNTTFLADLASCRAVVSTAGNQLVGEAIHFGKPMLVMPEDCVEQRVNARAVERLGIGRQVHQSRFSAEEIHSFLRDERMFRRCISRLGGDGRAEALAAIEEFLSELTELSTERTASSRVA
ncbi:MAG: hypothetical protein D6744_07545 [Planctomycetota bacterium]|nr:MAG: hypothetical protein D6744_07545 [Planctomycetota bacterium]